ncbi:hypothetical protein MKZ38_002873 [Zalerion maritima]|uniref:Ankyrin n=1 Tax=Zalerion maritima TaxID=339359 RepID=A0AAD5WUQ8_9PEZI|nr:hypothetical protein MKZ38_002873 [Zalerion maritima]
MSSNGLTPGLGPIVAGTIMQPNFNHVSRFVPNSYGIRAFLAGPTGPPGLPIPSILPRVGPPPPDPRLPKYPAFLQDDLDPPVRGPREYALKHTPDRVKRAELQTLLEETKKEWTRLRKWAEDAVSQLIPRSHAWYAYGIIKSAAVTILEDCRVLMQIFCVSRGRKRASGFGRQFEVYSPHEVDYLKAFCHQLMRLRFYQIELDCSQIVPTWSHKIWLEATRMDSLKSVLLQTDDDKQRPLDSALHRAIELGKLDLVRQLIGIGVPIDGLNRKGQTPLMTACTMDQYMIVRELVDRGANVNYLSTKTGQCPLSCTMNNKKGYETWPGQRGSLSMIAWVLLEAGANVNWTSRNGLPLLHYAVHYRDHVSAADFTYLLLIHGASLSDLGALRDGRSWMHHLAARCEPGQTPLLALVLDQGECICSTTERGHTPLFFAARKGYLSNIRWLVRQGADPNHLDEEGSNMMFYLPFHDEAVQKYALSRYGFDPNFSNKSGATALHYAVLRKDIMSVGELMRKGAAQMWSDGVYRTQRDWRRKRNMLRGTPLDIAVKLGCRNIVHLIQIVEKNRMVSLTRQIRLENGSADREVMEHESWYAPCRDAGLTLRDTLSAMAEAARKVAAEPSTRHERMVSREFVVVRSDSIISSNSDVENESPNENGNNNDAASATTSATTTTTATTTASVTSPLWEWIETEDMIVPRWMFDEKNKRSSGLYSLGKRFRDQRWESAAKGSGKDEKGGGEAGDLAGAEESVVESAVGEANDTKERSPKRVKTMRDGAVDIDGDVEMADA